MQPRVSLADRRCSTSTAVHDCGAQYSLQSMHSITSFATITASFSTSTLSVAAARRSRDICNAPLCVTIDLHVTKVAVR